MGQACSFQASRSPQMGQRAGSGLLLSKFARLVKAADARVRWGGDFPGEFKDFPHFEVSG